ncbi:YIR protein [Plasmodium yoelii]|uniref:YIR protein n=1 Tax=Plasmodium yoelii TaxID=5861 RepID=A0A077X6E9_PLAYE|nr:YIR protein [Plasmodium yoelii]
MDKTLCEQFDILRSSFSDDLENYDSIDFHQNENIKYYCSSGESGKTECKTDLDKINAGCLWLFEQLFLKNGKNINTVEYIIIWLSYKLNKKTYAEIKNLNDFYTKCIENNTHYTNCKQSDQDCSTSLKNKVGYQNYKEIINKRKNLFNISIENMSKIYDVFKPLCNVYTELGGSNTLSEKSLKDAKQIVEKYNELNVSDISEDSPYYRVLSTLLNDYNNLKEYCGSSSVGCIDTLSLTPTETEESGMQSSEKICNDTPSFSICSLFVLRKRAQKQYLREKVKK